MDSSLFLLEQPRGHEPRGRAGLPACQFAGLSSPANQRAAGKSPAPADKSVCPTEARVMEMESGSHLQTAVGGAKLGNRRGALP
jgi:hypothetical protein